MREIPWRHTRESVFAVTARGRRPWEGLPAAPGREAISRAHLRGATVRPPRVRPPAMPRSPAQLPTLWASLGLRAPLFSPLRAFRLRAPSEQIALMLRTSRRARRRAMPPLPFRAGELLPAAQRPPMLGVVPRAAAAGRAAGTDRGVTTAGERAAGAASATSSRTFSSVSALCCCSLPPVSSSGRSWAIVRPPRPTRTSPSTSR